MSAAGKCIYCEKEIDPSRDYRKVEGFERSRSGGGTNAIRLREPKDEWACAPCVDKLSRGIAPEQGSLL